MITRSAKTLDTEQRLERLLLEGLKDGEPTEMTSEDWVAIRREALKQIEVRRSGSPVD